MPANTRRILIPLAVGSVALGIVLLGFLGPRSGGGAPAPATPASAPPSTPESTSPAVAASSPSPSSPASGAPVATPIPSAPGSDSAPPSAPAAAPTISAPTQASAQAPPTTAVQGLRAAAPAGAGVTDPATPSAPLGSLDPRRDRLEIRFARGSAGIDRLTLSEAWITARAARQARAHYKAMEAGEPNPPPLPSDSLRDVLKTTQPFKWYDLNSQQWRSIHIPVLAAHSIRVDGQTIDLWDSIDSAGQAVHVWAETAPGEFRTQIVDASGHPLLDITRRFVLPTARHDLTIEQRIVNRTDRPLDVRWTQYGPGELDLDRSRYIDLRRFMFGYLPAQATSPHLVLAGDGGDLLLDRAAVMKRSDASRKNPKPTDPILWPNPTSVRHGYELSWFGSTSRYFTLTAHPPLRDPASDSRALTSVVERIEAIASAGEDGHVFTNFFSPQHTLAPGQTLALDLGVYAGPLDRHILEKQDPYRALNMSGLILYQMSTWCAWCTFQWLAHGLLWFLSLVHSITFDWGIAIIVLVCVVRALLHPLTRKSQIGMQRFGRAMQSIKPEIDKLQKKFPNDPKRVQMEQVRLMREHGVSPLGCLNFLPIFLQTPIWIALYAMLYFAYDLRQQPAFWGVFQWIGGDRWQFLADLSAADHCFWAFAEPHQFLLWNVTGINLLPFLMGAVFYFQQKYMSPPPSASMTREQEQQQKIMKVMLVVMMPVMLYSAPSGLNLYIFTSSLIGILEGHYIRKHMDTYMAAAAARKAAASGSGGGGEGEGGPAKGLDALFGKSAAKSKDPQARAFADAIARAKAKKNPPRTFKERRDT